MSKRLTTIMRKLALARSNKLTPERRSEIARAAAATRWGKQEEKDGGKKRK